MTTIKLLHVSAPGCHLQGIFSNKRMQVQHAYWTCIRLLLDFVFLCARKLPEDGTPVPKHVGA